MTMTETEKATKKHPRQPRLDRELAVRLAATEYERVADLLEGLSAAQWLAPTDCPAWDVRAMAGHMLGMVQMIASVPELVRQQATGTRRAKRAGGEVIDSVTALQVEKNAGLTTQALVDELRRLAPRAVRARRRAPGIIRRQTSPQNGEWWTLGYMFDVILTRDPFLHRVDICRATGVAMTVTADHEGAIVDDVVREWAGRHGSAYDLTLTGPAGGRWQQGDGGQPITMDALEFCRVLSGRGSASGLLSTQVPF
jgi:uncharacterized protein (TIGR03083 family)